MSPTLLTISHKFDSKLPSSQGKQGNVIRYQFHIHPIKTDEFLSRCVISDSKA